MSFEETNSDNCKRRQAGLEDTPCQKTKLCWRRFCQVELQDLQSAPFWRACFAEFVGTLLLCFYNIGVTLYMPGVEQPSLLLVAIGHGLYVASVIAALGATSGCHINPAVTLALLTLGQMRVIRSFFYVVSQCVGAIVGTFLLREISHPSMSGNLGLISPAADISVKQVICTEIVITAFLLLMVVATSDGRRTDIQGSVPLTIGLAVVANTLLSNKVSGSCMNPARALGPAVVLGDYSYMWIYWLGPCSGALVGAHLYNLCMSPATPSEPASNNPNGRITEHDYTASSEAEKMFLEILPETDL